VQVADLDVEIDDRLAVEFDQELGIRAVAAEGQVAGQGVALNLAVRLGQEGCAAQVVGVVVEQAVVVRQGSGPMHPG
jgi:hypothetical protein